MHVLLTLGAYTLDTVVDADHMSKINVLLIVSFETSALYTYILLHALVLGSNNSKKSGKME